MTAVLEANSMVAFSLVCDAGDGDADEARDVVVGADEVAGVEGVHVVAEENSGVVGKFGVGFGVVGYEVAFLAAGGASFGSNVDDGFVCPRALRVQE
jgi:hypothetical protein